MMKALKFLFVLTALLTSFVSLSNKQISGSIPVTGSQISSYSPYSLSVNNQSSFSSLNEFVESIKDGNKNSIRGVYAEGIFALKVIQQPANDPGFVSQIEGEITQFSLAKKYGTIGFLAHNFGSGQYFFNLKSGDIVQVIYGDGRIEQFQISQIYQYQALQPESPRSQFIDLQNGKKISSSQLFNLVYEGKKHITFQTCIQKDGIDSWGRLFVIATPIN